MGKPGVVTRFPFAHAGTTVGQGIGVGAPHVKRSDLAVESRFAASESDVSKWGDLETLSATFATQHHYPRLGAVGNAGTPI